MWHSSGWRCLNRAKTFCACCPCCLPAAPLLAAAVGGNLPSLLAPLTALLEMPVAGSRLLLLLMRPVSLLMRPDSSSPPRVCRLMLLPTLEPACSCRLRAARSAKEAMAGSVLPTAPLMLGICCWCCCWCCGSCLLSCTSDSHMKCSSTALSAASCCPDAAASCRADAAMPPTTALHGAPPEPSLLLPLLALPCCTAGSPTPGLRTPPAGASAVLALAIAAAVLAFGDRGEAML